MTRDKDAAQDELTVAVFAKAARAGRVMTRLAKSIGQEAAVELYRCFLADIAEMVGALDDALGRPTSGLLAHAGSADHESFQSFRREGFAFVEQRGPTLGARLTHVVERHFEGRGGPLVIIGTDSPTLGPRHFEQALSRLVDSDVAIGPSFDGGYYMIGLAGPHTAVFEEIDWSTPRVFGQTLRRCRASSLLCETLEFWYDVDTFDDLKILETHLFDYLCHRQPKVASRTAEFLTGLDLSGA